MQDTLEIYSSTMPSHHGFIVLECIPVLFLKCKSETDTLIIGKMLLRRKNIRLNAEDMLVILKQYNVFMLWLYFTARFFFFANNCTPRYTDAFTGAQSSTAAMYTQVLDSSC